MPIYPFVIMDAACLSLSFYILWMLYELTLGRSGQYWWSRAPHEGEKRSESAEAWHVLEANPWWLVTGEGSPETFGAAERKEWDELFASLPDGKRRAILAAARVLKEDAE